MGLSGLVGSGAVKGLEDIITEQLLQAKAAEEQRRAQAQEALQQQRIDQDAAQHEDVMGLNTRAADRMDAQRRDENNRAGVADMMAQRQMMDAQDARAAQDAGMESIAGDTTLPPALQQLAGVVRRSGGAFKPGAIDTGDFADPAAKQNADLAQYEARKKIDLKYTRPTGGDGGGKPQWLVRGGEVVQDAYKPGDKPYDAVQARNAVPSGGATEAADTAAEVARIATALRNHPGLPSAFGTLDSKIPTFRQSTADAEVLRDSLRSLLTLENMGKMKGVLSDADMRIIANASTTLNANMGDASARAELDRLIQVMGKASEGGGAAGPMPGPVPSHGAAAPGVRKFNPATGKLEPM